MRFLMEVTPGRIHLPLTQPALDGWNWIHLPTMQPKCSRCSHHGWRSRCHGVCLLSDTLEMGNHPPPPTSTPPKNCQGTQGLRFHGCKGANLALLTTLTGGYDPKSCQTSVWNTSPVCNYKPTETMDWEGECVRNTHCVCECALSSLSLQRCVTRLSRSWDAT